MFKIEGHIISNSANKILSLKKIDFNLSSCILIGENLWPGHGNGILLPKLFWPTVRKNCSSDWEKLEQNFWDH